MQEAEGKGLLLFSDRIETKCNNLVAECVAIDTGDIEMLKKGKQTNKNLICLIRSLGNELDFCHEHYFKPDTHNPFEIQVLIEQTHICFWKLVCMTKNKTLYHDHSTSHLAMRFGGGQLYFNDKVGVNPADAIRGDRINGK